MTQLNDDNRCFVCGAANPKGLKLIFTYNQEKDQAESKCILPAFTQGWQNVAHGGFVAMILDEAMVKAAAFKNNPCVTAEISVKYKKPTLVEQAILVTGKITKITGKIIFAESQITDCNQQILALGTAKLFRTHCLKS
jgi:uncharacterized protein (TIGR00369 family)